MTPHWKALLDKGLIDKKKYERLVRNYPLSDEELSQFISRQLVETRQSTKAVANILEQLYPRPDTEIVYVKAALASEFRHQYDMLKCREVNDLHHAKDAYLNIVVGNAYNVKFTHNKANFIKGLQNNDKAYTVKLDSMLKHNIDGAWIADNNESLNIVKSTMNKNNIRYTRYAFTKHGKFFDATIQKKNGIGSVPLKENSPRNNISKYGGYTQIGVSYFGIAKIAKKKCDDIVIFPVYIYNEKEYTKAPLDYAKMVTNKNVSEILIKKLKIDSLLSIDSYKVFVSGNGDSARFSYKPYSQLMIEPYYEKYLKRAFKYLDNCKKNKRELPISNYDGISEEMNMEIYKCLYKKMELPAYVFSFYDYGTKLKDKFVDFSKLKTYEQLCVLEAIVKTMKSDTVVGDIKKQLGISFSGFRNSKVFNLKKNTSLKIINQSVTGLFEQEIELLNL